MKKIALYLAGGGARGSYQAGVLKAVADILNVKALPFDLVSGVSVGSVNAGVLTTYAADFNKGTDKLRTFWQTIHSEQVFNASNFAVSKSVLRNISNLIGSHKESGFLLDTTPLLDLINQGMDFDLIRDNISKGVFQALEIVSHRYETEQTVSFFENHPNTFKEWQYPRHFSQQVELTAEHILASASLPLFFPTIKIDGFHYGDGSMGLIAPLRGAIRFNVDKILILGTRSAPVFVDIEQLRHNEVGYAKILGSMLSGLFMDNLDRDIEMVNHMNDVARLVSLWKKRRSPWHLIETLHIKPSADISDIAKKHYSTMPAFLRFMLNALGAKNSGDLLSFLLFEGAFTKQLVDLGYKDTIAIKSRILQFFESGS